MISTEIIWSPAARISYFKILDYLEQHWTQVELLKFANRTERVLELISQHPKMFPKSSSKGIHRSVITNQIVLFYRIKAENIELLLYWDARQDPKKLKI